MIYLDSAAIVKMVRREPCTEELVEWLNARPDDPLVASALVDVEVPRALRRAAPRSLAGVPSTLARLYRVEIDAAVRATAAAYTEPMLRSLDSVHLATAHLLADQPGSESLTFVTYDKRLLAAAADIGLVTAAPGA
ncbi:type II toxin-antitoxin system VapC family toxin [Streptomyces boninensis]|uniref:type II toxin-antitoxin system VapC family toxin n=1 Tax=Streptomyces boninensis TaxID=2039455 RepID=UPI003B216C6C